jgi:ATP-dependent exoDNAse (exonuclease V) beta subunit
MKEKKVKFYEKSHKYKVGTKTLTAVTKFVHFFFKPFDQKEIARKLSKIPKNKQEKKGVRYFIKEWKNDSLHGTKVHKALEEVIKGTKVTVINSRDELKAIQGQSFLETLPINEIDLLPEFMVVDTELGLAGTIDLLCLHNGTKEVTIYDYKTNKAIRDSAFKKSDVGIHPPCTDLPDCNLVHYSLQLSTYGYMLERSGYKIRELSLVHLREDSWIRISIDYKKFRPYIIKMIEVYNASKDNIMG